MAHHLIPLEAIQRHPSLMRRAARGGFDINGLGNGVLLDPLDHVGRHPQYSRVVLEELGDIAADARRLNFSEAEIGRLVQGVAETLRKANDDGVFRPWF